MTIEVKLNKSYSSISNLELLGLAATNISKISILDDSLEWQHSYKFTLQNITTDEAISLLNESVSKQGKTFFNLLGRDVYTIYLMKASSWKPDFELTINDYKWNLGSIEFIKNDPKKNK